MMRPLGVMRSALTLVLPSSASPYAFAQTSPVYVVRGGKRFIKAADVQFLVDACEAVWTRVQGARWRSDAERAACRAAIDPAKAFSAGLPRRP